MNGAEWNSFESQVGWALLTLQFEFYGSVNHSCWSTVWSDIISVGVNDARDGSSNYK